MEGTTERTETDGEVKHTSSSKSLRRFRIAAKMVLGVVGFKHAGAAKIQSVVRMHLARKKYKQYKKDYIEKLLKEEQALFEKESKRTLETLELLDHVHGQHQKEVTELKRFVRPESRSYMHHARVKSPRRSDTSDGGSSIAAGGEMFHMEIKVPVLQPSEPARPSTSPSSPKGPHLMSHGSFYKTYTGSPGPSPRHGEVASPLSSVAAVDAPTKEDMDALDAELEMAHMEMEDLKKKYERQLETERHRHELEIIAKDHKLVEKDLEIKELKAQLEALGGRQGATSPSEEV